MLTLLISLQAFLNMGGYGWYVWSAYCLLFLLLFLNIFIPLKRNTKLKQRLIVDLQD